MDQIGRVVIKKAYCFNLEYIETSSLQPGINFTNINNAQNSNGLKFVKRQRQLHN